MSDYQSQSIYFSNRYEPLFEMLSESLFASKEFREQIILVPNHATMSFLKKKIAQKLGVCMGVKFMFIQPFISMLLKEYFHVFSESHLEIALKIELEIQKVCSSFKNSSETLKDLFLPLINYIGLDKNESGAFNPQRITAISDYIASLFIKYSLFAQSIDDDFLKKNDASFQQYLWKRVISKDSFLNGLRSSFDKKSVNQFPYKNIFLFGFSFIPEVHLNVFKQLSLNCSTSMYMLSPSSILWEDGKSDFETRSLVKKLSKEDKSKTLNLVEYQQSLNPLLNNLGKLGRSFLMQINQYLDYQSYSMFMYPKEALQESCYGDLESNPEAIATNEPLTLLKALQLDILTQTKHAKKIELKEFANSLEVHQVTSKQREVELLYNSIINFLKANPESCLSDLQVLAPQFGPYIPYIESIFSLNEPKIDVHIFDYPFSEKNSLFSGLEMLVQLAQSRWDLDLVMELFSHPLFKKKFNISHETLKLWKLLLKEEKLHWGMNSSKQQKSFESDYQSSCNYNAATFEDAFNHLILQLTMKKSEPLIARQIDRLDFSFSETINQLIYLVGSLNNDLMVITENKKKPFKALGESLNFLIEKYFDVEGLSSYASIENKISQIQTLSEDLASQTFSFYSFWYYLKNDLSLLSCENFSSQLETLNFYTIKSKPASAVKATFVLGLNEGLFCSGSMEEPLCLLKSFSRKYEHFKSVDQDRYAFLEILLSTSEFLHLSYLSFSKEEQAQLLPSAVLNELLDYSDKNFSLNQNLVSSQLNFKQPHLSFDKTYFNQSSFKENEYRLAKSYYQKDKSEYQSLLYEDWKQNLSLASPISKLNHEKISITKLNLFAKDSIQFSLREKYRLYLADTEEENGDYQLNPLVRYLIKNKRMNSEVNLDEYESYLPSNYLGKLHQGSLKKEIESDTSLLKKMGVDIKTIMKFELRQDLASVKNFSKQHLLLPALSITLSKNKRCSVVGCLENITNRGLILFKEYKLENIIAIWPKYLTFCSLVKKFNLNFQPSLIFVKSQKVIELSLSSIEESLKKYLALYYLAQEQVLPLLPKWIVTLCNEGSDAYMKKVKSDLNSPYLYSPYTKALFESGFEIERQKLDFIRSIVLDVYQDLLDKNQVSV